MRMRAVFLAAILAGTAASARAELFLEGVHWQSGRVEEGRVSSWQDVRALKELPPRTEGRLRARVVLKNRGPASAEGLLVRYSLTARVVTPGGSAKGDWAVPFMIDARRVPLVGPNQVVDISLDAGGALALYLQRLARSSWRVRQVRLQAMLDPHPGVKAVQTAEDTLELGP